MRGLQLSGRTSGKLSARYAEAERQPPSADSGFSPELGAKTNARGCSLVAKFQRALHKYFTHCWHTSLEYGHIFLNSAYKLFHTFCFSDISQTIMIASSGAKTRVQACLRGLAKDLSCRRAPLAAVRQACLPVASTCGLLHCP